MSIWDIDAAGYLSYNRKQYILHLAYCNQLIFLIDYFNYAYLKGLTLYQIFILKHQWDVAAQCTSSLLQIEITSPKLFCNNDVYLDMCMLSIQCVVCSVSSDYVCLKHVQLICAPTCLAPWTIRFSNSFCSSSLPKIHICQILGVLYNNTMLPIDFKLLSWWLANTLILIFYATQNFLICYSNCIPILNCTAR